MERGASVYRGSHSGLCYVMVMIFLGAFSLYCDETVESYRKQVGEKDGEELGNDLRSDSTH